MGDVVGDNPLRSVADDIVGALPALIKTHPTGITVKLAAREFALDQQSARVAMRQANTDGKAVLMRRRSSREEYLVPHLYRRAGDGLRVCANCGVPFELRPRRRCGVSTYYDDRFCCTRSCSVAWSWTRPGTKEKRSAGIVTALRSDAGQKRIRALNDRRWSRPGERERLSAWNKIRWADPVIKAELTRAISHVNGSPEKRQFYSDLRKAMWADAEFRQKMVDGIKASKGTPEARALFSNLLRKRWRDPVMRKKYLAAVRKAAKIRGDSTRGKKQTPEHVAKRVASRRKTVQK